MATAPLPARQPPAPPQPGPAPPGTTLARWHYVDDRRTHEVHAGFRQHPRPEFVVREMAHGSQDPSQAIETVHPIAAAWEAKLHHMELEARLAMLGTYWRFDAQQPSAGWTRVKSLGAAADLRPVQEMLIPGEMKFYHFHHRATREEAVLLEIATSGPDGPRTMLARMDFRWPDATQGEIRILARDATAPLARSLLAREHVALRSRGYEKLLFTQDFLRAHSYGWRRDTLQSYHAMLRRISEGRLGRPKPGDAPPPPVDSTYTDFLRSLTDPRVVALHARFLAPGEEAELMREGDLAIKRAIQRKRTSAPREDQLMLNVLEASLLARWGLRPGQRAEVDPEVAAMVRRFAYYL